MKSGFEPREHAWSLSAASWIWLAGAPQIDNQYVQFRQEFSVAGTDDDAALLISVDSEYAVWLNGEFLDCGQYDDFSDNKFYDRIPLAGRLRQGLNVLAILAYYQGESSFQYIRGKAGLLYAMVPGIDCRSEPRRVLCRQSSAYRNGPIEKITSQLGFTFAFRAELEDGWKTRDYQPGDDWIAASSAPRPTPSLRQRPIEKLCLLDPTPARVIAQGLFYRAPSTPAEDTAAARIQYDALAWRERRQMFGVHSTPVLPCADGVTVRSLEEGEHGRYLLIDLGHEEAGYLTLDLRTTAGTILDIGYGEHLEDQRVRAHVGGRNFAVRYTCRDGRQQFTHYLKRFACRYLQIQISGSDPFTLYHAGLIPAELPVSREGSFEPSDRLFRKIYATAVRTLHLCMHEHYEDTPWREQALYGMDSRMQAICGHYCFGAYRFTEASLALLAHSLRDDGYMSICAPADFARTIPSFTLAWILEVADLLFYSGDRAVAEGFMPTVRAILDKALNRLRDGLLPTPEDEPYWSFYEWSPGLDGSPKRDAPDGKRQERYDAPLNLFLVLALRSGALVARETGHPRIGDRYDRHAAQIAEAIHSLFWSSRDRCYRTYAGAGAPIHRSELVQALALLANVCPTPIARRLRRRLAATGTEWVAATLSYSLYVYQALMQEPERYAPVVFGRIADDWGMMLAAGATSFWETIRGAEDFGRAGSLSHGWSATPVYFFYAELLGIKPLTPGFATFTVTPCAGISERATGTIPTPFGPISVRRDECDGVLTIDVLHPPQTTPIVSPSPYLRVSCKVRSR